MKIQIRRFIIQLILVVFLANVLLQIMALPVKGTSSPLDDFVFPEVSQESVPEPVTKYQGNYKPEDLNESTDLMYIEIKGGGYIISKTTPISQIEAWYSDEHELITDSLYGGKAYSFYVGSNYDSYLYIETVEDGTIFSYGSVDPSFATNTYSYGDAYPYNSNNNMLYGYLLNNSSHIAGGVFYNKQAYQKGNYRNIINAYKNSFEEEYCKINNLTNSSEIGSEKDLGLQPPIVLNMLKHSVLMSNAFTHISGNSKILLRTDKDKNGIDTFKTIEEFFYTNNQFIEFGSDLNTYFKGMDFTDSYGVRQTSSHIELAHLTTVYDYLLNPLKIANDMNDCREDGDIEGRDIPLWMYSYKDKKSIVFVLSEKIFERKEKLKLTEEEERRLKNGQQYYKTAMEKLYENNELYKTKPNYSSGVALLAGELLDSKKEGITSFYNVVRAGCGYVPVVASDEGFDYAQHKATALAYLHKGLNHYFARPDEMSLDYYNKAMAMGTSWSGDSLATVNGNPKVGNEMIDAIISLLFDIDGTYQFGHRRDLLNPHYNLFGYGITGGYAVFKGNMTQNYGSYPEDCVGYPAVNGITFFEATPNKGSIIWSAQFDDSQYKVLRTTTVEIKCLNSGEKWNFEKEEGKLIYGGIEGKRFYKNVLESDAMTSNSNKVLFYDSDLKSSLMNGNIYEVTIKGLQNVKTNSIDSYKYRTTFKYADTTKDPQGVKSVKIQVPEDLKQVESNVYSAEVGKTIKLNAKVDNNAVIDLKLTWTSSNSDAISVTQNGIITINKLTNQDVTIKVSYDGNNSVMDQIKIRPEKGPDYIKGDINQDKTVNINDVNYGMRGIVNKTKLTDLEKKIGDVNNDGTFNINDINTIMRFVVGKIKEF